MKITGKRYIISYHLATNFPLTFADEITEVMDMGIENHCISVFPKDFLVLFTSRALLDNLRKIDFNKLFFCNFWRKELVFDFSEDAVNTDFDHRLNQFWMIKHLNLVSSCAGSTQHSENQWVQYWQFKRLGAECEQVETLPAVVPKNQLPKNFKHLLTLL